MSKKTVLEMFKEIKELETADGPKITVEDLLPFFCKKVDEALERLEAIDTSKPSEALKYLEELYECGNHFWVADKTAKAYNTIKQALLKTQEQEKVLNELLLLVKNLEPTFNRKGVSSDTDILGTIIKDYFYDNASDLLKRYFK